MHCAVSSRGGAAAAQIKDTEYQYILWGEPPLRLRLTRLESADSASTHGGGAQSLSLLRVCSCCTDLRFKLHLFFRLSAQCPHTSCVCCVAQCSLLTVIYRGMRGLAAASLMARRELHRGEGCALAAAAAFHRHKKMRRFSPLYMHTLKVAPRC